MLKGKISIREALRFHEPGEKIEVVCYAGYTAEETPREIIVKDQRFEVAEVVERKREMQEGNTAWTDIFICRIENSLLKLERAPSGEWMINLLK